MTHGRRWRLRSAAPAAGLALAVLLVSVSAGAAARRNLWYRIPQDTVESFDFQVRHSVKTEFVRLPPEAEPFDVPSLEARIASVDSTASGRLERFVARVFRDNSLGLVSRLVDVSGTVDRGDGEVALDLSRLEGKSLAVRMHVSGELLDSFGWSHFSGAGQGGDLAMDVLLQSVLRLPNVLPTRDQTVGTTFRLRVPVDPLLERDQSWVLSFRRGEAECARCVALLYEGEIIEKSSDSHPARPMKLEGRATVSGTVVLGAGGAGRNLISHDWTMTWDRTIRSVRANDTTRGEIRQLATISGRVAKEGR